MAYKYQKLYDKLKSMAKHMPSGAQLPTLRNLMDAYGVSQATVDRAIDALQADRIVESVEGEGFFVARKDSSAKIPSHLKICMAQNDYPSTIFSKIEGVLESFFVARGHEFQVVRYPWAKGLAGMLKPGLVDAFIDLPPGSALSPRQVDFLKSLDVPAICLSLDAPRYGIDSIWTDMELGGMMAAAHLLSTGCVRLAFLRGEPDRLNSDAMYAGFKRQCLMSGLQEPRVIDCGTRDGEVSMRKSYEGLSAFLRSEGPAFDALFADSDHCAIGSIRACHDAGIRVPDEIRVMGLNGAPETEFMIPSTSTIRHDLDAWAAGVLEIIERRLAKRDAEPVFKAIAPLLTARESTAAGRGVNLNTVDAKSFKEEVLS